MRIMTPIAFMIHLACLLTELNLKSTDGYVIAVIYVFQLVSQNPMPAKNAGGDSNPVCLLLSEARAPIKALVIEDFQSSWKT